MCSSHIQKILQHPVQKPPHRSTGFFFLPLVWAPPLPGIHPVREFPSINVSGFINKWLLIVLEVIGVRFALPAWSIIQQWIATFSSRANEFIMHTVFPAYLEVVSLLSSAVSADVIVVACFIRTPVIFPNLSGPKALFVHNEAAFLFAMIWKGGALIPWNLFLSLGNIKDLS